MRVLHALFVLALNLAIFNVCEVASAQLSPPDLAPVFTMDVPGFPGADGNVAVAICDAEMFYVNFGDRAIHRLFRDGIGTWHDSSFEPQSSSTGYVSMRIFGSRNHLVAIYSTAYSANKADIFERSESGVWALSQTIASPTTGSFVYLHQAQWSGSALMLVDRYADAFKGAAYIYQRGANGHWVQEAKLQGSGAFSYYTEIWSASFDRDRAVLGHWLNTCGYGGPSGIAYVFERTRDGSWNQVAALRPPTAQCADGFASQVTIRGNDMFSSVQSFPLIHRFVRGESGWSQAEDVSMPVLSGSPVQGVRVFATAWGFISRTTDARLVAYEPQGAGYRVAGVLVPPQLQATDCYCWNIASEDKRILTMTSKPTGGAQLSLFDIAPLFDCDGNGIPNADEIASGAPDTNANGVPDICESTILVPSQYPTIQAAIDAVPANSQRTVQVAAGTYNESFSLNGKDVLVRGAAKNATILDGTGLITSIAKFTGGEPATAGVESLVFRNGTAGSRFTPATTFTVGGAIFATNTAAHIADCRFENCRADYGGAVYQLNGLFAWNNCVFVDNIANDEGGAVLVYNCTGSVSGSSFAGNRCGVSGPGSGSAFKAVGSNGDGESVVLDSCAFTGGYATSSGAAVEFYENIKYQPGVMRIVNTSITGNISGEIVLNGAAGLRVLGRMQSCVLATGTNICNNTPKNVDGPYFIEGAVTVCGCAADITDDGVVNGGDLGVMLSNWGLASSSGVGDISHDGVVDGVDLAELLARWGTCQ